MIGFSTKKNSSKRLKLKQSEVDSLYLKPYLSSTEVEQLLGISRQGLWYLVNNGTFKKKYSDFGSLVFDTSMVIDYALTRRKELISQCDSIRLPSKILELEKNE